MRPVGEGEQQAVATRIEDENGNIDKRNGAGTIANEPHQCVMTIRQETVGLVIRVAVEGRHGVDQDDVENEEGLTAGRDETESQNGSQMFLAPSGRINEIGVEPPPGGGWEGQETKEREDDGHEDTAQYDDEAVVSC